MRKIQIDLLTSFQNHAGYKARIDCREIFSELGFKELNIKPYIRERNRIHNFIVYFNSIAKIIISLAFRKGIVIIQYPLYSLSKYKSFIFKIIFALCKGKIILFIHDIEAFRDNYPISDDIDLIFLLDISDYIILHTDNMKNRIIRECNINSNKIKVLGPFDYLTDDSITIDKTIKNNKVIFAGNLNKSKFINKLGDVNNITFYLYGIIDNKENLSHNAIYKGIFNPNKISSIEGDWGLVWDGDSINECSGRLGEYLKYNSSHKFSLYIAAGKPVIVWKKSGLSKYVEKQKIGITIDRIDDIDKILKTMSPKEKEEIKYNVSILSNKIRNGHNTKRIISEILNEIK